MRLGATTSEGMWAAVGVTIFWPGKYAQKMKSDRDYNRSSSWNEYFQIKKQQHPNDSFAVYNQSMLEFMRLARLPTLYGITWQANLQHYNPDPLFTIQSLPKSTKKDFAVFYGGRHEIGKGPWDLLGKYE